MEVLEGDAAAGGASLFWVRAHLGEKVLDLRLELVGGSGAAGSGVRPDPLGTHCLVEQAAMGTHDGGDYIGMVTDGR